MDHVFDLASAILYVCFRVVILPVLALLGVFFLAVSVLKTIVHTIQWFARIRIPVAQPANLFSRLRFTFSKQAHV